MRLFSLTRALSLETNRFRRTYLPVSNPQAAEVDRLYLEIGQETRLITDKLRADYGREHPQLDEAALKTLDLATLGLYLVDEHALLSWPDFPARLGRVSSRCVGEGLYFHRDEAQVLPAQLQALRARKPDKARFRIAVVNGFGANLGDCTLGSAAFRHVLACLNEHLPAVACDLLFGLGTNPAVADIAGFEPGIERVLFHAPTVRDFAQYDAYFDFSGLISLPKYDELPTVDWYLWWCGLDPQRIPAEHKRNRGSILWDAWNAVRALLKDQPGKKVLFNPKASVPLRSMPEDLAVTFARRLLELDAELRLVIDQPLALKHKRLINLAGQIDSPEKFKALVAQVDGVVTVNSFASHVADLCATPAVHLCACLPGSFYPYYPFSAAVNPPGYEQLPAYGKVKVSDEEWPRIKDAYHAAWARLSAADVLDRLKEKIAQRRAARGEPQGLRLVSGREPACCIEAGKTPRLRHFRLAPQHARAAERLAQLTGPILLPGSTCVLAGAPEPTLPLTLAERLAPYGELIVFEPRTPLAHALEASFLQANVFHARVHPSLVQAGAAQLRIHALDPWSESTSTLWGNTRKALEVPNRPLDALALTACHALLILSPMPFAEVIQGALATLERCRPFLFLTPVRREEAGTICKSAMNAAYDFWAEPALPGQDPQSLLLMGVPREKNVKVEGFLKVKVAQ